MAKNLVEKFKEDFANEIAQDDHICPDTMIRWLEENA